MAVRLTREHRTRRIINAVLFSIIRNIDVIRGHRHVLIIVDIDDILRRIIRYCQRNRVCISKSITIDTLYMLVAIHFSAILDLTKGLLVHLRSRAHPIIANRHIKSIFLPYSIQHVIFRILGINARFSTSREINSIIIAALRGPANELVTTAHRQTGCVVAENSDLLVVQQLLRRIDLTAEVIVVGYLRSSSHRAVHSRQGDVLVRHLQLILRIVGLTIHRRNPVKEHLTRGRSHAGGSHDVSIGVLGVILAVNRRSAASLTQFIGDSEGRSRNVFGIQRNIVIQLLIMVKGNQFALFILDAPASPLVAIRDLDLIFNIA